MRPRCVVFHFIRHALCSKPTPSFYYNTYTLNLVMLVYQLRRVLLSILKCSLYGQLHSTLFLGTQLFICVGVTQVSNSCTLILFRELKFPYAWEVTVPSFLI